MCIIRAYLSHEAFALPRKPPAALSHCLDLNQCKTKSMACAFSHVEREAPSGGGIVGCQKLTWPMRPRIYSTKVHLHQGLEDNDR